MAQFRGIITYSLTSNFRAEQNKILYANKNLSMSFSFIQHVLYKRIWMIQILPLYCDQRLK